MIRKDLDSVVRNISFDELLLTNGMYQSVAVLISRDDHSKVVELWAERADGTGWGLLYTQTRRL